MTKRHPSPRSFRILILGLIPAVTAACLAGCGAGTPDPATEATDPAKAPRGGDMVSTQMRAGQRAIQAVDKANATRDAQIKELE